MNFELTDEQRLLKESLGRLLKDRKGDLWPHLVEMGLMALPFSEGFGGLDGGPVEIMIVMEALGEARALVPYFLTVVLGGGFVRLGGNEQQKQALIPAIIDGSLKLAFACTERHSRYDLENVETIATRDGEGFRLSGTKRVVLGGDNADKVFVTAKTSDGISLFLVDTQAEGVHRQTYLTQDGMGAADFTFDNVRLEEDAAFAGGVTLIRRVTDMAIAALCAEAIGTMSAMQALTLDYLKTRQQFGVAIGSFQALQHKAVDMYVAIEQARSIMLYATMMCDSEDDVERAKAIHAAKAEVGRCGRIVGETAIQLHGGVGITAEFAVGHYFKRMTMIDMTFGNSDYHLRRLAQMGGLFEVA